MVAAALALTMTLGAAAGVDEPFNYFRNPWTLVGLPDYPDGTRISPRGSLVFASGVEVSLLAGAPPRALGTENLWTLTRGRLPIPTLVFTRDGVAYRIEVFAAPMPRGGAWSYPSGDANYVTYVRLRAANPGRQTASAGLGVRWNEDGAPAAFEARDGSVALAGALGDVAYLTPARGLETSVERRAASWNLRLSPGDAADVAVVLPAQPVARAAGVAEADPLAWREQCVRFWERTLARGARFSFPEAKAEETLYASLVYQLIGNDGGIVKAGEGFYDGFFLRDGSYQIWSYHMAGYAGEARRAMEHLRTYQRPDGQFVSQEPELDGNGQGLWAIWNHYAFTRDTEWLAATYPQMRRGVEWLQANRVERASGDLAAGVLPKAAADGENLWAGNNQIVGYDVWNLRGVQATAWAAEALGRAQEASEYRALFEEYRQAIIDAVRRTGVGRFPPSYQPGGTSWDNLSWLHPTVLIDPHDPRVGYTFDHERFGRHGFVEGTTRWSPWAGPLIHPYMSTFLTNSALVRGEQERAVTDFYWYLLHTTSAHALCEGLDYVTKVGWGDVIPHLWAAADYIILVRNMLIREQESDLHLLSAIPPSWLEPGKRTVAERAPTQFGQLSMVVSADAEGLRITLDPPRRNPPARVILHLPPQFAARRVSADGRSVVRQADGSYVLDPATRNVRVTGRLRAGARLRTFASTVAEYRRSQRTRMALPALVKLPLTEVVPSSAWHTVNLRPQATTDPFTAPFNVAQKPGPGAYLFTDLPTGRVVVEGVPFEVIDPARNDGQGFVVLNGASECSDLPRVADIPVNQPARRVFFLGAVGGWAPADAGSDGRGLVARFVIEFTDGSSKTLPLISGATIDDWASPPVATDVSAVLHGPEVWHLNVLGVETGGREIRRIRFIDEGTPTSPVLAAVTLQGQ